MPTGILTINNPSIMLFTTLPQLNKLIAAYFAHINGEYHFEDLPAKGKNPDDLVRQKVWDREPEPATISGLIWHLGFESRAEFDKAERSGEFAATLKRAHLRVEAEYEKKLHQGSPTGAIFALKTMGWREPDANALDGLTPQQLYIQIVDSKLPIANSERDVEM